MNPASLMKLVTTYAALELLGPGYVWRTPVYAQGSIQGGTLHGNLYIRGQGDPKLVIERLWLLLHRVQAQGIRHIHGDIVLDHSAFEVAAADPASFDGAAQRPYNVSPDALLLNFKALLLTLQPDPASRSARVLVEPTLAGLSVTERVPLSGGDCGDYRSALQASLSDPNRIVLAGGYPSSCGEQVWPIAYADPASYAARLLAASWRELGGRLDGSVRDGSVPPGLIPIAESVSPPLAELVRDINKYSNNVMAQQLFLTLGLAEGQRSSSLAAARAAVLAWLRLRRRVPSMPTAGSEASSSGISGEAQARRSNCASDCALMRSWRDRPEPLSSSGAPAPRRWPHQASTAARAAARLLLRWPSASHWRRSRCRLKSRPRWRAPKCRATRWRCCCCRRKARLLRA